MTDGPRELKVQIDPLPDADADELARLAEQLRSELDQLDVQAVELVREGEVPPGAKAVDVMAVGALVVKLAPTAIGVVTRVVQRWLRRSNARGVELWIGDDRIKLDNASSQDHERLIALLEAKHGVKQGGP
jgi:hypothetical protein